MTTGEIILVLYWGVVAAIWVFLTIDAVAVTIRTTGVGACLLVLIILGSASIGFIWRARSSWRRSLARPIPDRGPSGWLWRQPGWLLALLFGILFYLATIGGIQLGDLVYNHGSLRGSGLALLATFPALLAIGQAARWCVRRERQSGSAAGISAADVARGSQASLDRTRPTQ